MNPNPVKIAVVGIGMWCRAMADAMQRNQAFQIVTCYTRTNAKRDEFAAAFHCDAEDSYENLVRRADVEAILLTTPNNTHAPMAILAAKNEKHVLTEKPIANRIPEAKQMIEACRRHGVVLFVAHNQRRMAGIRKMKEMVEARVLGKVIQAEANFSHNSGFRLPPQSWRNFEDECPGGPMMTLGVHPADSVQYLLGPVETVSAFYNRLCLQTEIIDVGAAVLRFTSGALGYLSSNFITPWVNYCNLYGTEANLYFTCELPTPNVAVPGRYGDDWNYADRYTQLFLKQRGEDRKVSIELGSSEILIEEVKEFADCIRKGKSSETGGQEAMKALAVILGANRSAREGVPVKIADLLAE